jgi:hypothetical protein
MCCAAVCKLAIDNVLPTCLSVGGFSSSLRVEGKPSPAGSLITIRLASGLGIESAWRLFPDGGAASSDGEGGSESMGTCTLSESWGSLIVLRLYMRFLSNRTESLGPYRGRRQWFSWAAELV